jgi:poly-gamma-glutamate synthesis protein (capsule biosynthesis protein)
VLRHSPTITLLGGGYLGSTYVDYGMGDFEFYVPNGGVTAETGVLVLTVDGRRVSDPRWVPGQIVDGLPTALSGESATAAQQRWSALHGCAGLTAEPIR